MRELRPTLTFAPELLLKAQGIRAAIFDVDGVLTDGRLYISEAGETLKTFNVLDGHGLKLLAQAGITPLVITGRDSPAVRRRLADLGLQHAAFGAHDKVAAAEQLLSNLQVGWDELAVIGDDWPDLPLMLRARFVAAPAQAHVEVRALADYVTALPGGLGAAREFCDLLLIAAGRYADLLTGGSLATLDAAARPVGA
ncbi:KdsC family phosphatase [Aquabacterium sp.]|uniref:KdsC family phosphatase n=1 Tax=Aquabacterium sp. TaxID=1872578 RepID=UPI0035B053FC